MGLKASLDSSITPKNLVDLWLFNFAEHKDSVDLSSYENTIQFNMADIISEGGTHTSSVKVFPVIFHALIDTPKLLTPSGENIIDFNVAEILRDINYAFRDTGIQFKAVAKDENGDLLDYPGLNIVNVLNLQTQRVNTTTSTPSANDIHRYTENGVAVSEYYESSNDQTVSIQDGISLESIYSEFSWNSDRVINIFLINGFSSSFLEYPYSPASISPNPFLYDSIKLDGGVGVNFNITLPFWALGNPYVSPDSPGYGYKYITVAENAHNPNVVNGTHYLNNQIAYQVGNESVKNQSIGYYGQVYSGLGNKARPLIKSLGHLFGLANLTNTYPTDVSKLLENPYLNNLAGGTVEGILCFLANNTSCFYKSFNSSSVAMRDCVDDTTNISDIYVRYTGRDELICGSPDANIIHNYMHTSNVEGNSLSSSNYFSPQQILRMNANINLNYLDTNTGSSIQGVLKRILSTNTEVYDFENVISCTGEDNSKIIAVNRSLAMNFDEDRLNANELFEQTKNNITNIVNTF